MNALTEIPDEVLMRAGRFLDEHAGVRDPRQLVALAFMDADRLQALRIAGLTAQQRNALRFIDEYQAEHGSSPSYDEIAEALGLVGKSGVHRIVSALVERGRLTKLPNRARSLVIVRRAA